MSLRRASLRVLAAVVLFWLAVPRLQPQEKASGGKSVATVNGVAITENELKGAVAAELERLEAQRLQNEINYERSRHQILQGKLESMLQERLFTAEAAKQGISPKDLIAREVDAKVKRPSDQDVTAFYEANKARINQPKEKVAPQVRKFLEQQAYAVAKNTYVQQLMKQYPVTLNLEPLRLKVDAEGHPSKGPADAPVTILEFSDFECVHCQRLAATLEQVRKDFPSEVRLVFRHFPLEKIHPNAQKAAEASLCAGEQDQFWAMHDALFGDQGKLTVEDLKTKAAALKLDQGAFNTCLDSGRQAGRVKKDLQMGTILGLTGTPALFINGRVIGGAPPYDQLAQVINEELKRSYEAGGKLR